MSLLLGFYSGFRFRAALRGVAPLVAVCVTFGGLSPTRALAADEEESSDDESAAETTETDELDSADETAPDDDSTAETKETDAEPVAAKSNADRGSGIWEDPKEQYLFIGARYRLQVVPKFIQNLFAEGGETLIVNTPGIEFAMRKDAFETNIFAMLGLYSMDNVPFKGNTDVELAWETIDASYQVLFLGSDFMWSTPEFSQGLSMTYGAGIGLGIVFGEMNRTQAYPDGNGSYLPCTGRFTPNPAYCDTANDHYDGYVEPSWADGGSSPLIFPWIAGQLGLRYKAHRNFVARLEAGITVTSVFFGIGADYGL